MSIVRVYRWDDVGAPAHPNNDKGTLAALLRACLVTGYGAKAPAGWTEPFPETNNYACFRSTVPNSQFYQINDNEVDSDVARIVMCDSMSSAEVAIGQNQPASPVLYFGKWHSVTYAANNEWFVIADEKTCYMFLSSIYGFVPHGIGDIFSYETGNTQKDFVAGHFQVGWMTDNLDCAMANGAANHPIYLARGASGSAEAVLPEIGGGARGVGFGINCAYYCPPVAGFDVPVSACFLMASSSILRNFLGKLRGIYFPLVHKPRANKEEFVLGGKSLIALNLGGDGPNEDYYTAQMFIDITGSWEESA